MGECVRSVVGRSSELAAIVIVTDTIAARLNGPFAIYVS